MTPPKKTSQGHVMLCLILQMQWFSSKHLRCFICTRLRVDNNKKEDTAQKKDQTQQILTKYQDIFSWWQLWTRPGWNFTKYWGPIKQKTSQKQDGLDVCHVVQWQELRIFLKKILLKSWPCWLHKRFSLWHFSCSGMGVQRRVHDSIKSGNDHLSPLTSRLKKSRQESEIIKTDKTLAWSAVINTTPKHCQVFLISLVKACLLTFIFSCSIVVPFIKKLFSV